MTNQHTAEMTKKKPSILVADDEQTNQKLAKLILQKAGYDVDTTANGQQAVEACQKRQYDLILMDIQMPQMDGLAATEKIRGMECCMQNIDGEGSNSNADFRIPNSKFSGVPIIAMTGNATGEHFVESEYPGMNDCIAKPMQRDLLLSVVKKWIKSESDTANRRVEPDISSREIGKSETKDFPMDLNRATREFMGKTDILFGVLHEFVRNAGTRINAIHQAVESVDYRLIASEAHAIKGAAANLTADALAHWATELEEAAQERQPQRAGELANRLEQEFYLLEKFIQQNCMSTR
jgi:CheY-like chemotaxis protein/HPt (histidine-containing phosphotransfer) domain-containing protein